jgi:hypothetical protein
MATTTLAIHIGDKQAKQSKAKDKTQMNGLAKAAEQITTLCEMLMKCKQSSQEYVRVRYQRQMETVKTKRIYSVHDELGPMTRVQKAIS